MASKKSTRTTKKKTSAKRHYPVVRSAELGSTIENFSARVLDVPATLSKLNRRLYRFARVYPVSISMDPGNVGSYEVYALRDDWAIQKGLQHAYKAYLAATADERANMSKSQIARWEDFRVKHGVLPNNPMFPKLYDATLTGTGSMLTVGEFTPSEVVLADGTTRTFTFAVPSGTEYGILQEYDKAGNAQPSPNSLVTGSVGPYAGLEDGNDGATYTDLEANGDNPPYDATGVNAGTPFVKVATLGTGPTGDQKLSTGFFNAPCGLVVIVGPGNDWNSDIMRFEVKAGQYKGVGGMSLLE